MKPAFTLSTWLLTCWFCFYCLPGLAQSPVGIVFDKLPQDYQLYPRNAQSEAFVPISGRITLPGRQFVSVSVFRNKKAVYYKRVPVAYAGSVGTFKFDSIRIRAEKAQYDFTVYFGTATDSVLAARRSNVVAGDVYVLAGQSNASAYFNDTRTNEFCRTFGKTTGTYGIDDYNPADTLWTLSNKTTLTRNAGVMGFELQQHLLEKYGIPTCLINAAAHWSMMAHYAERTPTNPTDLTNRYGRLLYRLQKGGLTSSVKALIYRQGESEAYGEGINWGGNFKQFYTNVKADMPGLKQLYVFQIDLIDAGVPAALQVREAQRALANTYPDVQVLASIGTPGFDGLHYSDEGYKQNGQELTRLLGRDFYADPDTDNSDAPNPKKAYLSAKGDELTILYADNQELVWPADFEDRNLINHFYLNGKTGLVTATAGRAVGNRIVLTLKAPITASKLTYLPLKGVPFLYRGPYLTNKRGMRALAFTDFPVDSLPPPAPIVVLGVPSLTVTTLSTSSLSLSWTAVANATGYVLEQKERGSGTYLELAQLPTTALSYTVSQLTDNTLYTFRLKATRSESVTTYTEASGTTWRLPPVVPPPSLTALATFATVVDLIWTRVPGAVRYVVEHRTGPEAPYKVLATPDSTQLSFRHQPVEAGVAHDYQLKAVGPESKSVYARIAVTTPALLATPSLSLRIIYADRLELTWPAVPGATAYEVERRAGSDGTFQRWRTLAGPAVLKDTSLVPGSTYTYRVRAIGERTHSPLVAVSATLPALLTTPDLRATPISYDAIQVSWSAVAGATRYVLARRTQETGGNQPVTRLETTQNERLDTLLRPDTQYFYELTAYGDKTNSAAASLTATTLTLLSAPADPTVPFALWPNPAQTSTTVSLPGRTTGRLRLVDSRGVVWYEQPVAGVKSVTLSLGTYPAGIYLVLIESEGKPVSRRLLIR